MQLVCNAYGEAVNLGDEANRARSRLESIEDRIDFLTLESQAPGFVRSVTAARATQTV